MDFYITIFNDSIHKLSDCWRAFPCTVDSVHADDLDGHVLHNNFMVQHRKLRYCSNGMWRIIRSSKIALWIVT